MLDIAAPILLIFGISYGTSANASLLSNFEIVANTFIQSAFRMNEEEKANNELDSLKLTGDFFKKIIIRNDIIKTFLMITV